MADTATPLRIPVTVFSDYICPFCYIGKHRLARLAQEFPLAVTWRLIEIHPETPLDGVPRVAVQSPYLRQVWQHVERLAAEDRLPLHLPPILANSSFGLIAAEYARRQDRFTPFHDALFDAYWLEGKNIGQLPVLQEIAHRVGLPVDPLRDYFRDGDWDGALDAHRRAALQYNVTGVPTFVIGEQVVVGAQPLPMLRKAVRRAMPSRPPSSSAPRLRPGKREALPISRFASSD